jgi:small subunit ribosomal protein S20
LAHSRSALKRWRQSLNRRARNRSAKGRTRTLLTRAVSLIGSDTAEAETAVKAAVSALDRAAQKGIIHANAAARSKSRLLKRFNLAQAQSVAAAAGTAATEEGTPPARGRRAAADKPATPRTSRARAAEKPADDKAPRPRTRRTS